MSLETVAEGVETPEQAQALVASGCTQLQGYLLSRPVTATALPGLAAALRDRLAMVADPHLIVSPTAGTTAAPTAPGCPG